MKIMFILFLFFGVIHSGFANDERLNTDLNFTNRAQCALDSKEPTQNALVLLSNMDIGRSLYRLAKATNQRDTAEFTKLGLNKYRYTVLSLIELIHQKIVDNKLPLLPADLTLKTNLSKYSSISEKCSKANKCPELDDYLADTWEESIKTTPNFQYVDNIKKDNFLNIDNVGTARKMSCAYLKKFTPLEAHLFGTKPNTDLLEQIAKATKDVDSYYANCNDYTAQESLKVSTYEVSVGIQNSPRFKAVGFDYWNTLKIYFSWAFRNSKEAAQMAFPFDEVFSSILIEDSLFMVPNGCKSMVSPKCDPQTINQGSMRMFASHDFKQQASSLDIFRSIPDGATGKLLEDPFPAVNQDILSFGQFESADAWLDTFRQNFSETRLLMRKRFVNSVNTLSIMSKNLNTDNLKSSLVDYFRPVLTLKEPNNTQLKSELYYLCAESTFLSDEELSYLRSKIDILGKLNTTDGLTNDINSNSLIEVFEYYKKIVTQVNALCSSFDQGLVFDAKFVVDQSGFNRWYTDTVYEGKVSSMASINRKEKLQGKKPLIAYALYNTSKDIRDVICIDSTDCARVAIQSIVDLYSVNQYSEVFLNIKNEIATANMLNPYAERTACKVYDPWFKTKASLFAFGTDVAQAVISSVTPGVVYGNFDLQPGKVTTFNQLVKDGKIQIDPKYEKAKVLSAVALDLGSFTNVPCSVSISKSKDIDPSKILGFRGVTIRKCSANETNTINVETSNEIGQNANQYKSTCLQCSLDFEHVSSSIANAIPFGKTAFFMARAIVRLYKGLKDPVNVPRSWSVNPYLVKTAYDSNGGHIPSSCVSELIKGRSCMKTACENTIVNSFRENGLFIDTLITDESFRGIAKVKLKGCKNTSTIKISARINEDNVETCSVFKSSYAIACEK